MFVTRVYLNLYRDTWCVTVLPALTNRCARELPLLDAWKTVHDFFGMSIPLLVVPSPPCNHGEIMRKCYLMHPHDFSGRYACVLLNDVAVAVLYGSVDTFFYALSQGLLCLNREAVLTAHQVDALQIIGVADGRYEGLSNHWRQRMRFPKPSPALIPKSFFFKLQIQSEDRPVAPNTGYRHGSVELEHASPCDDVLEVVEPAESITTHPTWCQTPPTSRQDEGVDEPDADASEESVSEVLDNSVDADLPESAEDFAEPDTDVDETDVDDVDTIDDTDATDDNIEDTDEHQLVTSGIITDTDFHRLDSEQVTQIEDMVDSFTTAGNVVEEIVVTEGDDGPEAEFVIAQP